MADTKVPFHFYTTNVRVRLTDRGRAIHRAQHDEICRSIGRPIEYEPPAEDAEGWSEWRLAQLARDFGGCVFDGLESPFMGAMELVVKECGHGC